MESKRATHLNDTQKRMLVQFMSDNQELQSGHFTPHFTKKEAQRLWEDITVLLNAVPNGARKNWVQWRKAWQDQKKNIKSKISRIRRYAQGTGGGPPNPENLSEFEIDMAALIKPVTVKGEDSIQEPEFNFDFGENSKDQEPLPTGQISPVPGPSGRGPQSEELMEAAGCSSSFVLPQTSESGSRRPKARRLSKPIQNPLETAAGAKKVLHQLDERSKMMQDFQERKLALLREDMDARRQFEQRLLDYEEQRLALMKQDLEARRQFENHLLHILEQ